MTDQQTSSPQKAVVIGTGKISEEHLRFLDASPLAQLCGVCDLSPAMAKYAAQRFNAKDSFTNYRDMLDKVSPDVVHILTPPHTHVNLVTDCLNANAHVIIEKPVAPTNQQFLDLWQLAQDKNRHLIEDHNYRFNEPILAIEKLVADNTLGDITEVEVRMALPVTAPGNRYADLNLPHPSHNMPAGVIHEFLTHLCYLLLRFMQDFDSTSAKWSNYHGGDLFKYDDLDALVVNNNTHGRIRFTAQTAPDAFNITVRGTKGYAHTDLFLSHLTVNIPRAGGGQLSPLANQFRDGWHKMTSSANNFLDKIRQKTPYEGLQRFLNLTYAAITDDTQPPVTFDDMNNASLLVDALVKQQEKS